MVYWTKRDIGRRNIRLMQKYKNQTYKNSDSQKESEFFFGPLAQQVERQTENLVALVRFQEGPQYREMEESGRPRLPWTQELAGSNPAFPTKWGRSLTG